MKLPEGRVSAQLIYHPASKGLLLIDGYQIHPDSPTNNVWKWDGKEWKILKAKGPGSRSLSSGKLNTRTGVIWMFGGVGRGNYGNMKNDTWGFDGKQWSQIQTNNIGTRDHHQMIYADHLDAFVLYGGQNEDRKEDTLTWVLKNNMYKSMAIPGPGGRAHYGLSYDPTRMKVVLYGGIQNRKTMYDLWEFDGSSWIQIPASIGPRSGHSMVYDDDLKMVVLHGGQGYKIVDKSIDTSGRQWTYLDDTWGWDGSRWIKIADGGPATFLGSLGYDPLRKVVVAYGGAGLNNTMTSALWELKAGKWNKVSDNGRWEWVKDRFEKIK